MERGQTLNSEPQTINLKGGPEPLEKEIHEILGSKREDRFSDPFFEVVQKTCQVDFSYLLRLGNFCKGPRTLRKFLQKCQKMPGVEGAPFMYTTSDRLDTWLIPSGTTRSRQ